jgi:large subunit ribosomal protein L21
MFAIVECGGAQFKVFEKRKVRIPRITAGLGEKYRLEKVLLVSNGRETEVGRPVVKGAVVEATIVGHPRSAKIVGVKYKPKKDYRRRWGARTLFTELMIETVSHPAIKPVAKPAEQAAAKKAPRQSSAPVKKETKAEDK